MRGWLLVNAYISYHPEHSQKIPFWALTATAHLDIYSTVPSRLAWKVIFLDINTYCQYYDFLWILSCHWLLWPLPMIATPVAMKAAMLLAALSFKSWSFHLLFAIPIKRRNLATKIRSGQWSRSLGPFIVAMESEKFLALSIKAKY